MGSNPTAPTMTKELSCGCLVFVNDEFLIVQAKPKLLKHGWDIPKGRINPNEDTRSGALRELWEETNYDYLNDVTQSSSITDLGQHEYYAKKDLHLYLIKLQYKPWDLKCNSTFSIGDYVLPEVFDYKWVTFTECEDYLYPSLYKVLTKLQDKFSEIV